MSTTESAVPQLSLPASSAGTPAARNYAANLKSFEATQRELIEALANAPDPGAEWIFARDGALTAMLPGDRWWAGCSLPERAARFMLKTLDIQGPSACFLSPMHAAQLRAALNRMSPHQAILAIVPESATLRVMLHCDNFAAEILAHRLWFVTGQKWQAHLRQLLLAVPGLPTPTQFIRPIAAHPESIDGLIGPAQKIFAEENDRRANRVQELRTRPRGDGICLIASSRFEVWQDSGSLLADILPDAAEKPVHRFDVSDPAGASPLALASAIAESNVIIAADVARADVPDIAPLEVPWITWLSGPRIPPIVAAGPSDALLVTDASFKRLAIDSGWREDQVSIATWPSPTANRRSQIANGPLSLIADTFPIDPPPGLQDFSSHVVLWKMIREELAADPFLLGDNPQTYLTDRMQTLKIPDQGLNRGLFLDRLIVPSYQQSVARILRDEKLPIRLFGGGWREIEEFSSLAAGPVTSRQHLLEVAGQSAALVNLWPWNEAHPVSALCRPIVRPGTSRAQFLRDARQSAKGAMSAPAACGPPLSAAILRQTIGR